MTVRASQVVDWAYDMGIERPKIFTVEGWNGEQGFIFSCGPLANRKRITINPKWDQSRIKAELAMTLAPEPVEAAPAPEAPIPAQEPETPPAASVAPAKPKRKGKAV